jgi:tetratricopeptide (TPR) repeat protein
MTQFYPNTAYIPLERTMGFLGANEDPSDHSEMRRYQQFCHSEPDSPLGYAALAHRLRHMGDPQSGWKTLDDALATLGEEPTHTFWLSARIHCALDLGYVDQAAAHFQRWPESQRQGYEYWRSRAVVLDEALGQYDEAIAAYDEALRIWPGPVEWRLRFRKANCLTRAGRRQKAAQERTAAKVIEDLNRESLHVQLREKLAHLDDPAALEEIALFYEQIHRPREAELWRQAARRHAAGGPGS